MSTELLEKMVRRIDDAFTLPMVMQEVLDLTSDPNASAKRISRAIANDPVLGAKVLRVANSSLFGFLFKTNNIEAAVVRLGQKQIRQIATALSVGKFFAGDREGEGYSRIGVWKHSVSVGVMNELLTKSCPVHSIRQLGGEALLAGLVHDIGIILEDQYIKEKFHLLPEKMCETGVPMYIIERKAMGFDHAMLGAAVLGKWRLPADIREAVARHHEHFVEKDQLLTVLTMMSEMLVSAYKIGFIDTNKISRSNFAALQDRLGLQGKAIAKVRKVFPRKIKEALEVFTVDDE